MSIDLDIIAHATSICWRNSRSWGWPVRHWPDDLRQEIAVVALETPDLRVHRLADRACRRLARAMGWHRVTTPEGRRTMHEPIAMMGPGYRHAGGAIKRAARLKVSPERRREIAAMGGRASARSRKLGLGG